jgi:hypothetical protein
MSGYLAGKILNISGNGIMNHTGHIHAALLADIAFTAADKRLIVPHANENKIAAYDISGALQ